MKKLLAILILSFISSNANATTPIISNISGAVGTGQTLTITGTNMVNDNRSSWMTSPVNFQTGNAYGFEGTNASSDGYCSAGGCDGNTYSTTVKLMGNKSADFHVSGAYGSGSGERFALRNSMGFSTTNYYGRFYLRYDVVNNTWPDFELKMSSTQSSGANLYVNIFGFSSYPNNSPTSIRIVDPTGSYQAGTIPGGSWVSGRWYCVEWQVSSSSATVWINGQQVVTKTWSGSFSPQFYEFGPINGGATPSNFDMHNYFDAMAFKASGRVYPASKIEISGDNGSTWKWQHPVYLSDTSIQVSADLPTKTAANYLLRITNNLQQTSTSYNLSTGGSSSSDTQAPTIPANLLATAVSSSQINLSWLASSDNIGVTGYKIYRGGSYIATTTGTSYSDTGLSASTSYSYKVSAIDASGNESSQSTSDSATTQAETVGGGGAAGGTTLFEEHFDNSSYATRGWYDNTNHGTISSGGQSGNCLQWAWSQGATSPTNGGSMRMKFTPTDSLYISYYVKFQSGWRGSQKTYHPHMMYILSDLDTNANAYSPLANNYLDTYIEFLSDVGSPYTIRPQIALQDNLRVNSSLGTPPNNLTSTTENRSVAYCNTPVPSGSLGQCFNSGGWYSANTWLASSASVSTNAWHHVEVYLQMNTISGGKGQSNGIMQEWLDGVKVIDHSDVLYRTNQDATKKWAQFVLAPYMGDGAPIAETMWIDELTVETAAPNSSSVSAPSVSIMSISPN